MDFKFNVNDVVFVSGRKKGEAFEEISDMKLTVIEQVKSTHDFCMYKVSFNEIGFPTFIVPETILNEYKKQFVGERYIYIIEKIGQICKELNLPFDSSSHTHEDKNNIIHLVLQSKSIIDGIQNDGREVIDIVFNAVNNGFDVKKDFLSLKTIFQMGNKCDDSANSKKYLVFGNEYFKDEKFRVKNGNLYIMDTVGEWQLAYFNVSLTEKKWFLIGIFDK